MTLPPEVPPPPLHDLFGFLLDDDLLDTAIVESAMAMLWRKKHGLEPANDNTPQGKNTC